jgi:hypothetical protein
VPEKVVILLFLGVVDQLDVVVGDLLDFLEPLALIVL